MRRYGRRDAKHRVIVAELRQAGFSVLDLASVGQGVPDLLVGRSGHACLVELKSEKSVRKKGALLEAQQQTFIENWRGPPVIVAFSSLDVVFGFNSLLRKCHATRG